MTSQEREEIRRLRKENYELRRAKSVPAYYQRAKGERSLPQLEDERLLEVIRATHKRNYEAYGYRRTWKALLRAGERIPRCQVQRLMRPWDPGRQPSRQATAHHQARPTRRPPGGPGAA